MVTESHIQKLILSWLLKLLFQYSIWLWLPNIKVINFVITTESSILATNFVMVTESRISETYLCEMFYNLTIH